MGSEMNFLMLFEARLKTPKIRLDLYVSIDLIVH